MPGAPDPEIKFETPTISEGVAFAIGSVAGVGAGLLIYSSKPNPAASAEQKIGAYQAQIYNIEHTVNDLPVHASSTQTAVTSSLIKTIGADEKHIQTLIANKPPAHDNTGTEAGIMLEGATVLGLAFAVASVAIRNVAYRHRKKQAQAFKDSVEKDLGGLSVRHPEGS